MAQGLFGNEDPIGKRVTFNMAAAIVIGVVKEDKLSLDQGGAMTAYIPITYMQNVNGTKYISSMSVKASSKATIQAAKDQSLIDCSGHVFFVCY